MKCFEIERLGFPLRISPVLSNDRPMGNNMDSITEGWLHVVTNIMKCTVYGHGTS
jgi:hypothetical protein